MKKICNNKLLERTINLDIFFINKAYGWERLEILLLPPGSLPRSGIISRIFVFFFHLVSSFRYFQFWGMKNIQFAKQWFFFETINQRESLKPVANKLKDAVLVNISPSNKINIEEAVRFPVALAYIASIPFFPLVFFKYLISKGYRKKGFSYSLDQYWLVYGYYLITSIWIQKGKPTALVFSNDHNALPCAMMKAGKDENIPTIYIQHSSVTEKFPPLDFSYAFLDGMDALHKYDQAGKSTTQIFLVGMAKADKLFKHINTNLKVSTVGVCINSLDPFIRVEQLLYSLREKYPRKTLVIRPHPSDRRKNFWEKVSKNYALILSNPMEKTVLDFLKLVDVAIAGDSGILLEAAIMNVYPIYYDFRDEHIDHYGFEKNGLVERVNSERPLIEKLDSLMVNKPNVQSKTRYYCATIGTKYEGSSGKLTALLLEQISRVGSIDLQMWARITNVSIEAYSLKE